jgi:transposase
MLAKALCELLERYPADRLPNAGGVSATVLVLLDYDKLPTGLGARAPRYRGADLRRLGPPARLQRRPHPRRLPQSHRRALGDLGHGPQTPPAHRAPTHRTDRPGPRLHHAGLRPTRRLVPRGLPRFPRTPSQWFSGTTGRCPMANVYSQEFKDQIVEQHRQGRTFVELAKEFNLAATSISNWVRAADKRAAAEKRSRNNAGDSEEESDKAKVRRLERELARKEEELEILGKALAFFARRTDL